MTRGNFLLITDTANWMSIQFNGDMYPSCNGKFVYHMLESVETYDDLAAAILKFDEERFGYADMHDADLAPASISDDIDFSKDYFAIYNSDYLYIKNASNKDCTIIAKNGVKQTIKPGEIQIWNYGNLVALDDEVLEELELDDNEKKFVYGEQQKETEESSFDDRLRVIFEECYRNANLKRVECGKGIIKIYNGAFLNCQKLKYFELGDMVEEIGDSAFMNTALTEIDLPDSIWRVGRDAFNTAALHNGKNADVGPDGMYDISIPSSIGYIQPGAFSNAANVHTSFVNRKLINACLRSGNLQHCYPCNMWRLKIDGKPDIIMPKDIDRSKLDAVSDEINKFMLSEDTIPPEIYRYSQSATGLTAALEQCRKYPNTNLKRFITRNISIIFQNIICNPLVKNGEELMVGLINDKVFTDTALKRLLKEVEKVEDTQNLTVLKTYILNSISNCPQNTFRI